MENNEKEMKSIEQLAISLFDKFKDEFDRFKGDIVEMITEHMVSIKTDLSKSNRNIEENLKIHESQLKEHSDILKDHTKDIDELKSKIIHPRKTTTKVKLLIMGLSIYVLVNLTLMVFSIQMLIKILGSK